MCPKLIFLTLVHFGFVSKVKKNKFGHMCLAQNRAQNRTKMVPNIKRGLLARNRTSKSIRHIFLVSITPKPKLGCVQSKSAQLWTKNLGASKVNFLNFEKFHSKTRLTLARFSAVGLVE